MTDRDRAPSKNPAKAAKEKRLAEALRANLRRRKGSSPQASDKSAGALEIGPQSGGSKGEGR